MVFREVSVIEIREALRAWLAGKSERAVAAQAGVDRKTSRRYVVAAVAGWPVPRGLHPRSSAPPHDRTSAAEQISLFGTVHSDHFSAALPVPIGTVRVLLDLPRHST
jgi:hypothetical protein